MQRKRRAKLTLGHEHKRSGFGLGHGKGTTRSERGTTAGGNLNALGVNGARNNQLERRNAKNEKRIKAPIVCAFGYFSR